MTQKYTGPAISEGLSLPAASHHTAGAVLTGAHNQNFHFSVSILACSVSLISMGYYYLIMKDKLSTKIVD